MDSNIIPNKGKNLKIETEFGTYSRYPIKTHVIMKEDVLIDVLDKYVRPNLSENKEVVNENNVPSECVFISEKILAITQGRAFHVDEIKVSWLAKTLSKFVYKPDYGIGIGRPETMELCIREVGVLKVLFAGFCSVIGKLFRKRGIFYKICGPKARAIDGPCDYTIPPYNNYAKMAPDKPDEAAVTLAKHIGRDVVIIDANDIGVDVLGRSRKDLPEKFAKQVFSDNPLDQCDQQTPIAIVIREE